MEFEELQNLFNFLGEKMLFREPINRKDQIKYDAAFEELKKKAGILNIRNNFFIENESFLNVIYDSIKNGAKYLKVHLIEQDLGVNIGLSFSKVEVEQNNTVDNDLDFFWITDNNQLIQSNRKEFKKYKARFYKGTLLKINTHTNKINTEYVKYEIDDVIRYLIRNLISNTFAIKGIMFNQFVFKDYEIKMNDRISISVHALLEEIQDPIEEVQNPIEKNTANSIVSIGYDFGTVYP
jgi:hypothetical protein